MGYFVGIDGGGTRTTLGIADVDGREILRRVGPAGLVDPRRPTATAEVLVSLVREAAAAAGFDGPADGLCAGLAGAVHESERSVIEEAFVRAGVAERVQIVSDGQIALFGAFSGGPGILLIAGTGSVAWGRSVDGRIGRCGGWGMIVGDEGSGFAIARAGLTAGLRAFDGRGPGTNLSRILLDVIGLAVPEALPAWVGRAEKSEVAMLAVHVIRACERGDDVALEIVRSAASDLANHVQALSVRLGPWEGVVPIALHGGVATDPVFDPFLRDRIVQTVANSTIVPPAADAVAGALRLARNPI